ncbi:MAG: hypothetical protein IPJ61_13155 [Tessaracoccus sp.]|uniref:hypothetical protein n=1 Tax=Tessaracoccus sp. TaxID=1971211 RepID=UPI001EB2250B|nr:hypothetical protein [Tessaracoccus sp.]MBK7821982.1 hypothetical protein [Tessaracoccus sp.]
MNEDDIRKEPTVGDVPPSDPSLADDIVGAPDDASDGATGAGDGPRISTRTVVIAGILVVILAFLAGFIGARMGSASPPKPAPTVTVSASPEPSDPSPKPTDVSPEPDKPEAVVLPAGADVRAGIGVPDSAHGEEGDVFIDLESADVYVRGADGWRRAGNIRVSAVEHLTGEQGEQGKAGEQG